MTDIKFGHKDHSYQAAGEIQGITSLVNDFYQVMDTWPRAKCIRDMHPDDLETSKDKLTLFLCAWLGGPRLARSVFPKFTLTLMWSKTISTLGLNVCKQQ